MKHNIKIIYIKNLNSKITRTCLINKHHPPSSDDTYNVQTTPNMAIYGELYFNVIIHDGLCPEINL
jgi:hypothetical protein